jgi:hypothetical protein
VFVPVFCSLLTTCNLLPCNNAMLADDRRDKASGSAGRAA